MDKREKRSGRGRPEAQEQLELKVLGLWKLKMTGYRVCQSPARNLAMGLVAGATLALLGAWAFSQSGRNSRKHVENPKYTILPLSMHYRPVKF